MFAHEKNSLPRVTVRNRSSLVLGDTHLIRRVEQVEPPALGPSGSICGVALTKLGVARRYETGASLCRSPHTFATADYYVQSDSIRHQTCD